MLRHRELTGFSYFRERVDNKFAILMDGAFVVRRLQKQLQRFPTGSDVETVARDLCKHPTLDGKELLRIYFYNGSPSEDTITNPIDGKQIALGNSNVARQFRSLHQTLELADDFALRLGEAKVHGWTLKGTTLDELMKKSRALIASDLKPEVTQKGVDLRIGLDIARLALRDIVDTIVVVTGDSDFIPAFKFARRTGKRILLSTMGHGVVRELKVHADRVLD